LNDCDRDILRPGDALLRSVDVAVALKQIRYGREELEPGHCLARHRHLAAYAIVMLRGTFDQAGYAGRFRFVAGELLVQPTLDCHVNYMARARGATILRLPWPDSDELGGVYPLDDVDAIARAAERDVEQAAAMTLEQYRRSRARATPGDLPDLLAADLAAASVASSTMTSDRAASVASLADWARRIGVARETASRAFSLAFGVSARRFRAELHAREAWLRIVRTRDPLADIAVSTGFADQAHMTRSVGNMTGASPARWRRDVRVASYLRSYA